MVKSKQELTNIAESHERAIKLLSDTILMLLKKMDELTKIVADNDPNA